MSIQRQIEERDLDGALRLAEATYAKYPRNGGIENLIGVIEVQQGHKAEAIQSFSKAIEHAPRLVGAYLNLSRVEMETAATDPKMRMSALQHSIKAVQLDPANDEAHYNLANIYLWQKQYQSSLSQLERLSQAARKQVGAEALFCADHAWLGQRSLTETAVHELAANSDATEDDGYTCLPALKKARRADLIEELFGQVGSHGKLSAEGLRTLGLAMEANGKLKNARATLEKAFEGSDRSVVILQDLARVAEAAKDNEGALGYLAHARDISPNDPKLPYEFAAVCLRLNLFGEARKALEESVRLAPDDPDGNYALGLVVSFSADPSQALKYLKRYHELRPNDPDGLLALGRANYAAKDFETATKWLKQAALQPKTSADADLYLGRIARQEGRFQEAVSELNRSIALNAKQASAFSELGQISLLQRDFKKAEQEFDSALSLDPENYSANFGLLQLFARTSDPRREEQSKRFDAIKDKKEEQERQMMRAIEIRRGEQN
ncbi:MAG: tetratricopeptide repeat protein [Acidobacteria bacterium]|nr:tetratricopeptide repeat protein [Acidobacteriota bacterium]